MDARLREELNELKQILRNAVETRQTEENEACKTIAAILKSEYSLSNLTDYIEIVSFEDKQRVHARIFLPECGYVELATMHSFNLMTCCIEGFDAFPSWLAVQTDPDSGCQREFARLDHALLFLFGDWDDSFNQLA